MESSSASHAQPPSGAFGELVITDIALGAGIFSPPGVTSSVPAKLFSAITTIVTPVALKHTYEREPPRRRAAPA